MIDQALQLFIFIEVGDFKLGPGKIVKVGLPEGTSEYTHRS